MPGWPPERGVPDLSARKLRAIEEKNQRKLEREVVVLAFDYQPGALQYHGPIINTDLTITDTHREALVRAGQPVPAPVRCRFLIDTGAHGTVVKHEFAERAGLKLVSDNVPLSGVGVDTTGKAYMGRILFAAESKVVAGARHGIAIDTTIMAGQLDTDLLDGLIGRDVLQYFALSYDGKTGKVTMRYHKPERGLST